MENLQSNAVIPEPQEIEIPQVEPITDTPPDEGNIELSQEPDLTAPQVDNDAKRYQYWQSQADKYRKELSEYQAYAPVIRYMQDNPEVIQMLEESVQRKTANYPQFNIAEHEVKTVNRPVLPSKPANYNRLDALNDADSPSGKWLDQYNDYQVQMLEYLEKQEQVRQEQVNRAVAQQQAMVEQQIRLNKFRQDAVQNGVTINEFEDFLNWSNTQVSMQDLVTLYKLKKKVSVKPQVQIKTDQPLPAGIMPGQGQPKLTPQDIFNQTLRS